LVPGTTLFFLSFSKVLPGTKCRSKIFENFFSPKNGVPVLNPKKLFFRRSTGTPILGLKNFEAAFGTWYYLQKKIG
jgi:hypothetical protein